MANFGGGTGKAFEREEWENKIFVSKPFWGGEDSFLLYLSSGPHISVYVRVRIESTPSSVSWYLNIRPKKD